MSPFRPREAVFRGTVTARSGIDEVFPLFSPVGERAWVPGWDPELIHPPGVEWAEGQIFRTREETGDAIWVVSRLDREGHRVEYHRVEPGRYVARIDVRCRRIEDRITEATVEYAFVGLSESGNRDIEGMTEEEYAAKMARWTDWIERKRGGGSRDRSPGEA